MDPNSLLPRHEIERSFSIENARDKAAAEYARSPLDAENLTKWGSLLLELAQFRQGQSAIDMIEEAVSKFEEALRLDPSKHHTKWCLGSAFTSQGFLMTDGTKAYSYFKQATQCYQDALDEDQDNVQYLRALEMSLKAPSMYHELQKQTAAQKGGKGASKLTRGGSSKGSRRKFLFPSNLKYDVIGWLFLSLGIAAWVRMIKKSGFPTPPPVT